LPVFLVDDGSNADCSAELDRLAGAAGAISVIHRSANGGKGAAVMDGLRAARLAGYTHALQVDADGQHDLADLSAFLQTGAANPHSVICGLPRFDKSAPPLRYYGRYLTRYLVWINTLSREIPDAMCGFRLYPLHQALPVIESSQLGTRMDFDIEILVRLVWRGVNTRWLETEVYYPESGISHFRMVRDNLLISRAHLRLFLEMLPRAPFILWKRIRKNGTDNA
jgi:glycosyltransferase involved in cell wall biosynthesis